MICYMAKAPPADSDQIKHIPSHLGSLHVIPQLGWSFLHLQIARADVQGSQTWRFCWACESRPGTRCLDPTASRAEQRPLSSAERMSCGLYASLITCLFTFTVHRSLWSWSDYTSHQFVVQVNSTDFKVEHEQLCHSSGKAEIQLLVIDTSKERDQQQILYPVLY